MTESHKICIDQRDAAERIKERFGIEKALGYLIGEKLMNFVRAADQRPEFAAELPGFVAEIKHIFQPYEIRGYLESVRRVGTLAHVTTDEEYRLVRAQHEKVWVALQPALTT